jgi:hypothetical protein
MKGDFEVDKNGQICASIKSILTKGYQTDVHEYRGSDRPLQMNYMVLAILTLECDIVNNKIYFKNEEIRPGMQFLFKTEKYTLIGLVINNFLGQ